MTESFQRQGWESATTPSMMTSLYSSPTYIRGSTVTVSPNRCPFSSVTAVSTIKRTSILVPLMVSILFMSKGVSVSATGVNGDLVDAPVISASSVSSKELLYHQKLNMVTSMISSNNKNNDEDDNDWHIFGSYNENSSYQCSSSAWEKFCCLAHCTSYQTSNIIMNNSNDKPLWWLVLQWLKMMLFKMMRTYHAKPVLLMILPLVVGLVIGYCLGQLQQHHPDKTLDLKVIKEEGGRKRRYYHDSVMWIPRRLMDAMKFGGSMVWLQIVTFAGFLWNLVPFAERNDTNHKMDHHRSKSKLIDCHRSSCNIEKDSVTTIEGRNSDDSLTVEQREENVRSNLNSDRGSSQESGVPSSQVPKHVAVIMDGNRRFGKSKYGSASRGHWEGSSKLVEFAKWCLAEKVEVLTVFAFSSENWNREPAEVASLMQIFAKYCDELRIEAIKKDIKVVVLSTDQEKIPAHVRHGARRMEEETRHCKSMIMNICLSYGSREEIVGATKSIVRCVVNQSLHLDSIDENTIHRHLLTHTSGGDPDVLIRTSGEVRVSNFLLWQLAYTELFFIPKPWPAVEKEDLLQVIRTYANGRHRRYGR
ncbi:undecaprenyl diphosphate synthase [Nitzschia inconspicua]|uniref:Undecaprenyl diphosphate synthase n=1 Tax=Nitzschia inconspicua TaxID=303405 RepID=A0A9K3KIJ6_9STRA|nr:undecaprenyl diphosphate synthase [Nitzschia inconspicua]